MKPLILKPALFYWMLLLSGFFSPHLLAKLPVAVEPVTKAPLTTQLDINGTIFGKQDVVITAGVSGRLLYVAKPGDYLNKGEVLVRFDTLPFELDKAKQQEMLTRAQINLRFHQQELKRLTKLAKTSAAAASQVDKVQNQHDLALSDIRLAEVELRLIEDQLQRATITAPFSGVVSQRHKQAGRDVTRAEELINLIDVHHLETRFYVPVKYLAYLKQGNIIAIKAQSFNATQTTDAVIDTVIPSTDPRSQTIEVRANISSTTGVQWAIGQLVDGQLALTSNEALMLINRDALILRKQGVHIVKIDAANKAHKIPVTVGKGQGQLVAITPLQSDQLKVGDPIVVRGAERLTDGQEVEVQNQKVASVKL